MATQKELVAVVAKEMGIPIETVTVIDRYLAEAGLRTRAARGRGNTPMTYQDAANLIIATAWEVNPKDAVNLVEVFASLPAYRVKETVSVAGDALGSTFGEALAAAIEVVPRHKREFSLGDDKPEHMSFTVKMYRNWLDESAEILLVKEQRHHTFQYERPFEIRKGTDKIVRDLRRTAEFSQITLGFVGEAIADGFSR